MSLLKAKKSVGVSSGPRKETVAGHLGPWVPVLAGCVIWGESGPFCDPVFSQVSEWGGSVRASGAPTSAVSFVTLEGRGGDHSIRARGCGMAGGCDSWPSCCLGQQAL